MTEELKTDDSESEVLPSMEQSASAPSEETPIEDAPTEAESTEFSDGSWVRQVFVDDLGQKKIATTFVPDNHAKEVEREIEDYDDEDTDDWKQFLGDPPINIDEGVAVLRLDDEAEIAISTWLPNEEGIEIIRNTLKKTAESPGEPTANLSDFRNCFRNQAGLRVVQRFRRCRQQLHS
jgi:hypothetical protein